MEAAKFSKTLVPVYQSSRSHVAGCAKLSVRYLYCAASRWQTLKSSSTPVQWRNC